MAKYVTILKSSGDCLQWVKINKGFYSGDKDILLCMCYAVPLNSRVGGTCNIFECLSNDLLDFTNTLRICMYRLSRVILLHELEMKTKL